jgi:hypothetical protein
MPESDATSTRPIYKKVKIPHGATQLYMITCDEGWRSSIVCDGMYEWAADWLLEILGRRPFAPKQRREVDL